MKSIFRFLLDTMYRIHVPFALNRGELPFMLNAYGLLGDGAEIGVKWGQHSAHILANWKGRKLFSIDPWREFTLADYQDDSNASQQIQDENYQITRRSLAKFGGRSELMRMTSAEAAATMADHSLDFVYLDARHDYASVKEDIDLWFPKVKPGGIVSGHDYVTQDKIANTVFGVKAAVDEFVINEKPGRLLVTLREPIYKSWIIIKSNR